MFGRFFLIFLSSVSLAWILFIGYDLLDKKDQISPQNIFGRNDGAIIIINRPNETQAENSHFEINENVQVLAENLLKNVFPNERLYFSEKRSIVIIEIPRIWNEKLIQDYLKLKQIPFSIKEGKILLNSKFSLRFKKNYLLFSTLNNLVVRQDIEWPTWDNKASASIIYLSNPLNSTNIYFKSNGTISYQTKYGKLQKTTRVDDYDLFAQYLPSKLKEYHFYEKEFALNSKIIQKESQFNQWLDGGFVSFTYENTSCIVSDYNKSIDPFQLLRSDKESNDLLSNHFTNVKITSTFPSSLQQGFYLGKLGDKVILSEKKEVLERIVADYQLGNTLALDGKVVNSIFNKMPKKVSERLALAHDFFSLSSYKNLLIKTKLNSNFSSESLAIPKDPILTKNTSFSSTQISNYFLGNGAIVFSIGKSNELIAISNKKQFWRINLEGEIIGNAQLIDMNDNGKQQVLVATSQKLYVLNSLTGTPINQFPVQVNAQNEASFYRWNGVANFIVVSASNELVQINQNGRIVKKIKLKSNKVKDAVNVFRKGRTLTAIVVGDTKTQEIDLDRSSNLRSNLNLPQTVLSLKNDQGFIYFYNSEEGFVSTNTQGVKKSYAAVKSHVMKKITRGNEQFVAFLNKNQIQMLDKNGLVFKTIPLKISDADDFDIISLKNGKTYIAVLEGIENEIYILDDLGNQVSSKSYEGKNAVKLSDSQGVLTLTTNVDKNIVQHYNILGIK